MLAGVPIVPLLAIVAVATCRVVLTAHAHAPAPEPAQLVQLPIEPAASSMQITIASCKTNRTKTQIKKTQKVKTNKVEEEENARILPELSDQNWDVPEE